MQDLSSMSVLAASCSANASVFFWKIVILVMQYSLIFLSAALFPKTIS